MVRIPGFGGKTVAGKRKSALSCAGYGLTACGLKIALYQEWNNSPFPVEKGSDIGPFGGAILSLSFVT